MGESVRERTKKRGAHVAVSHVHGADGIGERLGAGNVKVLRWGKTKAVTAMPPIDSSISSRDPGWRARICDPAVLSPARSRLEPLEPLLGVTYALPVASHDRLASHFFFDLDVESVGFQDFTGVGTRDWSRAIALARTSAHGPTDDLKICAPRPAVRLRPLNWEGRWVVRGGQGSRPWRYEEVSGPLIHYAIGHSRVPEEASNGKDPQWVGIPPSAHF